MRIGFEVSAKAARLIGRENIADVDGALTELIKNAYDADASCVYVGIDIPFPDVPNRISTIRLKELVSSEDYSEILKYYDRDKTIYLTKRSDLSTEDKNRLQSILFAYNKIIVADNGTGMSEEIIKNAWMQIATREKEQNFRSAKGRIKTGAKGIGRFALDKLSKESIMYTRAGDQKTIRWEMDWDQFTNAHLLKEVHADIRSGGTSLWRVMQREIGSEQVDQLDRYNWETGTLFILSPTREPWNERLFQKINTNLRSINPFGSADQFDVIVYNKYYPKYSYRTERVAISKKDYDYKIVASFDGIDTMKISIQRNEFNGRAKYVKLLIGSEEHVISLDEFWKRDKFRLSPYTKKDFCEGENDISLPCQKIIDIDNYDRLRELGPFETELYFIKNGNSNNEYPFVNAVQPRKRKEFLRKFSGIKLYRDDFKVRPYGDEGMLFDWLDLDTRANKSPAAVSHRNGQWRVRSYQIVGTVKISRGKNPLLYDTANREGLTQNESYYLFISLLQKIIDRFEFDRQYIYREYRIWEDAVKQQLSVSSTIQEDVINHGVDNDKRDDEKKNDDRQSNEPRFTEKEYRETIHDLIEKNVRQSQEKQLIAAYSSSGVILNTFFHEFNGFSTVLASRDSQMRARVNYLLKDHPFEGPEYYDPLKKLDDYKNIDNLLSTWLEVVMKSVQIQSLEEKKIDIAQEISKLIELWGQLLAEKEIEVYLDNMMEEPVLISFSLTDLYVILNNFILNSVWFLEHNDQESRRITICLQRKDNSLLMEMMNNGPLLDEQYKREPMRVFEIGESAKEPKGTGLGLWLLREAAERHSGQVSVIETDAGFGLRVLLSIE